MDFVPDRTADGRPFRMLVVLDEYTRECLTIEVQRNFGGEDFVAFLDELTAIRGAPGHVRSDNGPEFISAAVKKWCGESGTATLYIDPASPWQNGIVESFNGRQRDELLSPEISDTFAEARYLVARWLLHYDHRRIQRTLGEPTPAAFAATSPTGPQCGLTGLRGERPHATDRSWRDPGGGAPNPVQLDVKDIGRLAACRDAPRPTVFPDPSRLFRVKL